MKDITITTHDVSDLQGIIKKIAELNLFHPIKRDYFIVNPEIETISFDFKGSPFIDISIIAFIALIIRFIAESNKKIIINWPSHHRGNPSAMHKYLFRTGFYNLFNKSLYKYPWFEKITFTGKFYEEFYDETKAEFAHYIQIGWFDESYFEFDKGKSYWQAIPILKQEKRKFFEDVLVQQGYVDQNAIDNFFKIIFKEIGWNAILHSDLIPGNGYGIFGAQIQQRIKPKILEFFLGDLGKSIPFSLLKVYDTKGGLNWESLKGISKIPQY